MLNFLLIMIFNLFSTISVSAQNLENIKGETGQSTFEKDCDLQVSPLQRIVQVSRNMVSKKYFLRSDEDTVKDDKYNFFPQVGILEFGNGLWGSGAFVEIKENGVVKKNKIITAAHNFFDASGKLRMPLESFKFKLGVDADNPIVVFSIKKIECTGIGRVSDPAYEDKCIITTAQELPSYLNINGRIREVKPLKLWTDKYNSIQEAIDDADLYYSSGFHGALSESNIRRINLCGKFTYRSQLKEIDTDCNISDGMSGGPIIATSKNPNGSYSHILLGSMSGYGKAANANIGAPYLPEEVPSNITVSMDNQGEFLRQFASK